MAMAWEPLATPGSLFLGLLETKHLLNEIFPSRQSGTMALSKITVIPEFLVIKLPNLLATSSCANTVFISSITSEANAVVPNTISSTLPIIIQEKNAEKSSTLNGLMDLFSTHLVLIRSLCHRESVRDSHSSLVLGLSFSGSWWRNLLCRC